LFGSRYRHLLGRRRFNIRRKRNIYIAYKMTDDELHAVVKKQATDHFVPKKPEPKQPVDPAGKKFFLGIMCQPKEK